MCVRSWLRDYQVTRTSSGDSLIADTHIVVWYILDPTSLPTNISVRIDEAVESGRPIAVSTYSVLELVYMCEKTINGITEVEFQAVMKALRDPDGPFVLVPVDADVAERVAEVPRRFPGLEGSILENADPGDRILVATALKHQLALATADRKLHALAGALHELRIVD